MNTTSNHPLPRRDFSSFVIHHSSFILALPLTAVLLLAAPRARAQIVTNTADSGAGSLRAVVTAAAPGATITFAPNLSGLTLLLTSGEISLNKLSRIDASALPGGVTIKGNGTARLFNIGASGDLTLDSLTLTNGRVTTGNGGAIYNQGGLTVNRCTVAGNAAPAGQGGGIYNPAGSQLRLLNSTFHANTADEGGAVRCLGATLTATNCTFTANTARIGGACSIADGSPSQWSHLTIAGNQATDAAFGGGGGLFFYNHSPSLQNSIVADNSSGGTGGDIACNGGTLTYQGNNLVQSVGLDAVTLVGPAPLNQAPLLAPLGNYGGPTQTMPLLGGSPAIDVGVATPLATDQRGRLRQFGTQVDLGAVERQPWIVTTLADSGSGSLRMAVSLAAPGDTIHFATDLSGLNLQLDSTLVLNQSLTVDASGLPAGIRILGTGRVLEIPAGQTLVLRSLEVRNGYATQGGGIYNAGTLTLDRCTLANNGDGSSSGAGYAAQGGGIFNAGALTLNQSTLTGNFANTGAAIYNQSGASLTVNDSTLTDNYGNSGPGGIRNLGALTLNNTLLTGNIGGGFDPNLSNSGTLTVVVTTTADAVTGSLRERLASYPDAQAITFATNLSGRTLTLTSGEMALNTPLAIDASALPGGVTIRGNGTARLFNIGASGTVTLDSLTLTNGRATSGDGGAIYNGGVLTLNRCTVAGSTAGLDGGGIFNPAGSQLTLLNSTFTGNTAREGGAVRCTGAAFAATNCTFTANTAGIGGACSIADGGPEARLSHLTVVGNQATSADFGGGGGLFFYANDSMLHNSIVAANTSSGTGRDIAINGGILTCQGNNLVQSVGVDSASIVGPTPLNQSPLLDPLGNYGGPTQTMPPQAGSPAIDAGEVSALTTDQRGSPRPLGLVPDLGAVEAVPGFTNAPIVGLPGVDLGSVAWGDYDNDGRLDFLLTGYNGNSVSQLWRNTGTRFTNVTANVAPDLPGVSESSVAWGDYDNDSRLDFLLTGSGISQLWRNTGRVFINVTTSAFPPGGLPGVDGSSVAWGDYDNDGRLDFLLAGAGISQLWRNTGSRFTNVTANVAPGLPGVIQSSVAWGDYDNDGRLDFLLAGAGISQLWRNTGSRFTNVTASVAPGLRGRLSGSVAWGDYDNDGRLDFLFTGMLNDLSRVSQLWRNTGSVFTNVTASVAPDLPGVSESSVAWGDYDNDGRLDFLLTGYGTDNAISQLWRNTGTRFTNVTANVAPGLPGVYRSSVAWGDYDNDGRLDFLLTGRTDSGSLSQLWRNNTPLTNTPPTAPTGLAMTTTSNGVFLSWNSATDGQTPASGLTYNVRAGTTPGGTNLLAAHVNAANGFRRVPALGNASLRHTLPLTGLTNGQTVSWSVQAVDTSFAGGPFATETSVVTIPTLALTPSNVTNATVNWTPPTWGWFLQERTSLSVGTWSDSPSGELNPVSVSATNPAKFYRLLRP